MVYKLALRDPRIVFIGSDLGHGTLKEFQRDMPERFFMEGISEAHVVGMAAGMALEGKIVYINTIAPFFTRRALDQIVVDLCMHKANVRLIGSGGGMVYAPLGATHEVTEDIAVMRSLPNMTCIAVADAEEMARMMPCTLEHDGPVYIRLAKGFDPIVTKPEYGFTIGKGIEARNGMDALVITTGICLGLAQQAAGTLAEAGVSVAILHLPTIKPLDRDAILRMAAGKKSIVTVEEHSIIGGLGSAVSEILMESTLSAFPRFCRIGMPDVFPSKYGSQADLMTYYGITSQNVVSTILGHLGKS